MDAELFPRTRAETAPGAVHVPDWLAPGRQGELLEACRAWARPRPDSARCAPPAAAP